MRAGKESLGPPDVSNRTSRNWLLLWAPFGTELEQCRLLETAGIEAYCPVVRTVRRHHRNKKRILKVSAAFPTYLFSRPRDGLAELRWLLSRDGMRSRRIRGRLKFRPVFVDGKTAALKQQDIDRIRQAETSVGLQTSGQQPGRSVAVGDRVTVHLFGHKLTATVRAIRRSTRTAEGSVRGKKIEITQSAGS